MKSMTLFTGLLAAALISFTGCKSQGVDLGYDAGTPLSARRATTKMETTT